MNKLISRTILICLGAAAVSGCFASSPQVSYYSLYVPVPRDAPLIDSNLAVSVGPVTIPDILKQTQIATGGAGGRYRLAEYHRWSGELDRDLARAVAEHLSAALGTEKVAIFPWDQNFTAHSRVLLDVLSMGGETGTEATLTVRWVLIDPEGKRPQIIRRSELRDPVSESGYPAWVAAQQLNIEKLGREIAQAIRDESRK